VLHQHRKHESHVARIFSRKCALSVKEADEKEKLLPGHVYIAPPNYHLLIEQDGTLSLSVDEQVNFSRPSIDVTFTSAAETYGETLIGILLTGANQDGAEGVLQVKRFGGLALIEDPDTAQVPTMPLSAIEKTHVDQILPLAELSQFLLAITVGVKKSG
jgi:two-component system chemotaxis response regulator CheB